MRRVLFFSHLFIITAMIGSSSGTVHAKLEADQAAPPSPSLEPATSLSDMTISLRTATDATIRFKTETEAQVAAPGDDDRKIPHLVLNRNGVSTPGYERTLQLSLGNLLVPASGLYVDLKVQTQHSDPDSNHGKEENILVLDETRFVPYSPDSQEPRSLDFTMVFQRAFEYQGTSVRTPTDYYGYQLTLFDPQGNILRNVEQKYAFLLESQWRVPLPRVLEAAPGAAPRELVIYFCDMVPFQSNPRDPESRIPRQEVERYIQTELVPAMVDAFEMQTNLWEMPWYPEWSNSRNEEDPKTLSVALGRAGTWFHGAAPSLGHAMISIRVDGSFGEYASLTDGIMSVFHHELFHNQQRNISFHYGSRGNIAGKEEAWEFISEGTAVLATLVGQPAVQLAATGMPRSYLKRANAFIGSDGMIGGGLNKSYTEVPYHTALYWRFLYEQCGGLKNGIEDPAAGMKVIRHVLETLYSGVIVDINASTSAIEALPRIIDQALQAAPACAHRSFDETLIHFTRAIYMLRRADGRCQAVPAATCGFFDPDNLYSTPNAERQEVMAGAEIQMDGSIASSFGLDLVELSLDQSLEGKSIRILFKSTSGPEQHFNVELWRRPMLLQDKPSGKQNENNRQLLLSEETRSGHLTFEIDRLNLEQTPSLDLVITRMDTYENTHQQGRYNIQVIVE